MALSFPDKSIFSGTLMTTEMSDLLSIDFVCQAAKVCFHNFIQMMFLSPIELTQWLAVKRTVMLHSLFGISNQYVLANHHQKFTLEQRCKIIKIYFDNQSSIRATYNRLCEFYGVSSAKAYF